MDELTIPAPPEGNGFEPSTSMPVEPEPPEMADVPDMPSAMPAITLPAVAKVTPSISQSGLTVPTPARDREHDRQRASDRNQGDRLPDLTTPTPTRQQNDKDKTVPARSQPKEVVRQVVTHQRVQPSAQPTANPQPEQQQPQQVRPQVQLSQPQLQPPQLQPAVVPAYSRPRQNWSVVALAMLALVSTLMFGAAALVGVRLVSAGRELASDFTITPATTALPTFDMPPPTVGVQIEPWNGTERFTVLMMGLDKRPGERGTAFRTDSMIIVSIDPVARTVGLLSVPRDLYIEIPPDTVVGYGYGLQRVNSAYVIGELARTGYGAQLAMQTVQYNLGMRIHDYVVFDFTTVIDAVNAVGGIDIEVKSAINDPSYPNMYYGYDPLYIPVGIIHMDGELALKYARSRHGSSDFDRAKRQQEVISALRDKILNGNMLPELLVQAPNLWTSMSRSVSTGLSLDQMLRLAVYLKDIPVDNIRHAVLDQRYVTPTMWDGASVLVPNRVTIGPLLVEVFGANYNQ